SIRPDPTSSDQIRLHFCSPLFVSHLQWFAPLCTSLHRFLKDLTNFLAGSYQSCRPLDHQSIVKTVKKWSKSVNLLKGLPTQSCFSCRCSAWRSWRLRVRNSGFLGSGSSVTVK